MAALFYLFHHLIGGLRDMEIVPSAPVGHEWEEVCTYLAVVLYLTGARAALKLRYDAPRARVGATA